MEAFFSKEVLLKLAEIVPYGLLTFLAILINYFGFKKNLESMENAFGISVRTLEVNFEKSLNTITRVYDSAINRDNTERGVN